MKWHNIQRLLVSMLAVSLYPAMAMAAPAVNTTSGVISSGNTITIIGSGFGTKSKAAPLRYDDFEHGTIGQRIDSTWRTDSPNYPIYSNIQQRYTGRQSALQRYGKYYGNALMLDNRKVSGQIPPTKEMYVTGWFWMETGGALSRNAKIINMGCAVENSDSSWNTRIDVYPSNGSGHLYADTSATCGKSSIFKQNWNTKPNNTLLPDKKWHRIETYLRVGANGYRDVWVDGKKIAEISGAFTGESCNIGYLLVGHYFATDTGTPKPWANRYWDEFYVDTTRARVEIGDAPVWGDSVQKEIQIPSAWSSSSIKARVNLGSFQAGKQLYLYVVDAQGNVNTKGFPIKPTFTSSPTPTITSILQK